MKYLLLTAASLCVVSSSALQAALVVANSNQADPYTVSNTDLINGLAPVFSAGNYFAFGEGGGTSPITNGLLTKTPTTAYGTVGTSQGGTALVYDLAADSNITSLDLYFGWVDGGRDAVPVFSIFTKSTVYANDLGSYTLLYTNPTQIAPSANGNVSRVNLTDGNGTVASGVRSLYFAFGEAENNFVGLGEIDVVGAAVPEPSTAVMLGLGALGGAAMFRRRKA